MKVLGILALALLAGFGCSPSPRSAHPYPYKGVAGRSPDKEVEFFKERLKSRPDSFTELNNLAQAYLTRSQTSGDLAYLIEAEKLAGRSLELSKDGNHGALVVMASVAEARHEFTRSLEIAQSIYAQEPSNLDSQALLANSLLELGRVQEAKVYIDQVRQAMPTSAAAIQSARVLIASGLDKEARELLEEAVRREQPQEQKVSARLRSLLGEIAFRHGRLDEARVLFGESIQVSPVNPFALQGLARVEACQGHYDKGFEIYTEAFAGSQNPAFMTEMARMKAHAGDKAQAARMLGQAESLLRPELEQGRFGHARDLAQVLLDQGKPEEALTVLHRKEEQRQDWRFHELESMALEALKKNDEALVALKKALDTGIQEPSLYYRASHLDPEGDWGGKLKFIDPGYDARCYEAAH